MHAGEATQDETVPVMGLIHDPLDILDSKMEREKRGGRADTGNLISFARNTFQQRVLLMWAFLELLDASTEGSSPSPAGWRCSGRNAQTQLGGSKTHMTLWKQGDIVSPVVQTSRQEQRRKGHVLRRKANQTRGDPSPHPCALTIR